MFGRDDNRPRLAGLFYENALAAVPGTQLDNRAFRPVVGLGSGILRDPDIPNFVPDVQQSKDGPLYQKPLCR